MTSLRTGYIYHELFGWHDTGTQAGFFPSDPARGLQPFVNYENAETKRRIHELIVVSGIMFRNKSEIVISIRWRFAWRYIASSQKKLNQRGKRN